jgi:hypothetical protein
MRRPAGCLEGYSVVCLASALECVAGVKQGMVSRAAVQTSAALISA